MRIIAHEGPFGHNTQQILSGNDDTFGFFNVHAAEGLAILGERYAVNLMFPGHEGVARLLAIRRTLNSALGTSFEKLAFYDCKSSEEIARILESPIYHRGAAIKHYCRLNDNRDQLFQFGSTPYFAGAKMIQATYDYAVAKIAEMGLPEDQAKHVHNKMLKNMYTGFRSAKTIDSQVRLSLEITQANMPQEGQTGVVSPMREYL